jgi:hypothetical protein
MRGKFTQMIGWENLVRLSDLIGNPDGADPGDGPAETAYSFFRNIYERIATVYSDLVSSIQLTVASGNFQPSTPHQSVADRCAGNKPHSIGVLGVGLAVCL